MCKLAMAWLPANERTDSPDESFLSARWKSIAVKGKFILTYQLNGREAIGHDGFGGQLLVIDPQTKIVIASARKVTREEGRRARDFDFWPQLGDLFDILAREL
jgi:CubicO group peptidase (beta-lactamase class C family)